MNLKNNIFFDSDKPVAFVVYDFETLTAYTQNLDAIELGAVILDAENEKILENKFEHFIKPKRIEDFNQFAIDLTGITPEDVRNAKELDAVLSSFADYSNAYNFILVAQNAYFDHSILRKNLTTDSLLMKAPCLDLIKLARHTSPGLKSYNLDALADHFEVPITGRRHRGLYDSELTGEILLKVLKLFVEKNIINLSDIVKIGQINKFTPQTQVGLFG